MPGTRARLADDRGAVLPLMAMTLVLLLTSAAFAVDLGMQRVVARDMQAVADLVALDMARQLDGRTPRGVLEASAPWRDALADSLARNDDHLGSLDDHVVEAGRFDQATGGFATIAATEVPNAVRVRATGSVAFGFAPATGGPDRGGATRSATAVAGPSGCFRLGSFALGLATQDSPLLDPILGGLLDTTAIGYQGLAVASIGLGDLAAELGVGTPEQLTDLDLTLRDLHAATARVLARQGDAASAAVLEQIAAQVSGLPQIALGDLLALGQSGTVALDTRVNVLDLVSGSALIANGTNAIAIPDLAIGLPGVTGPLTASLTVIQEPVIACNDAVAATSQVQLRLTGDFTGTLSLLGQPICVLFICTPQLLATAVSGPLTLTLDLATARGRLREVACATNPPATISVDVFDKSVASLGLGLTLNALGLPLAGVTATTQAGGGAATTHVIPVGDADFGPGGLTSAPTPTGSGSLGLQQTDLQVQLLNLSLLTDGGVVRTLLAPLLAALNTALVDVIAPQLGLTLAGADLWGVQRPGCAHPALRG